LNLPSSLIVCVGVTMPLSSDAIAVIGLKIEPVGYVAAIARLNSGAPWAC
jgi:hypothetical protein